MPGRSYAAAAAAAVGPRVESATCFWHRAMIRRLPLRERETIAPESEAADRLHNRTPVLFVDFPWGNRVFSDLSVGK